MVICHSAYFFSSCNYSALFFFFISSGFQQMLHRFPACCLSSIAISLSSFSICISINIQLHCSQGTSSWIYFSFLLVKVFMSTNKGGKSDKEEFTPFSQRAFLKERICSMNEQILSNVRSQHLQEEDLYLCKAVFSFKLSPLERD